MELRQIILFIAAMVLSSGPSWVHSALASFELEEKAALGLDNLRGSGLNDLYKAVLESPTTPAQELGSPTTLAQGLESPTTPAQGYTPIRQFRRIRRPSPLELILADEEASARWKRLHGIVDRKEGTGQSW
ncbi:uncharacterized protein UTRI_10484_B [Ustilago trichophora]|uniref:Uncharacterized protein n=1 Tax=Ustilago trichophora TaxID=86804 RepID=A0A5C3E8G8_9BASI|nr:uncharacterized protein UTRI_10484_B [Ustilago trichophora]